MRAAFFTLLTACFALNVSGASIGFQVSNLGGGDFQYTYTISGLALQANQTLDIQFSPTVYNSLLAGQAGDSVCHTPATCTPGTNWSLQLFPVNSPPGATGDWFATALVNNPSLAGPFTAEFTLNAGQQPGSQNYIVYNADFSVNQMGTTMPVSSGVPEPTTLSLLTVATIFGGFSCLGLRRRRYCSVEEPK